MKYQGLSLAFSALALTLASPVSAQTVVYQSVANLSSANENAVYCSECWFTNSHVWDQFSLSSAASVDQVRLWTYQGGDASPFSSVSSVGYTLEIWDSTQSTQLFSQHIYPLTTFATTNGAFGVEQVLGGSVSGLNLNAGSYWATFYLDYDPDVGASMAVLGFTGGNGSYTGMDVTNGQQSTGNVGYQLLTNQETALPTPEPTSWAMMVGGFGVIGAFMRRRRSSVSFA